MYRRASLLCCHLHILKSPSLLRSTEPRRLAIDVPVDVPQNYGYAGTEGYIAPELEDRQPYFFEVDTWSMALVLYEVSQNVTNNRVVGRVITDSLHVRSR